MFQGVYALWQFAVLGMLYPYLGVERFGLWVTVFSLTLWTTLGNLGIHQAILTHVGRFGTRGGGRRVDRAAWVGTAMVAGIGGVGALALLTTGWTLPWGGLLNVRGGPAEVVAAPTVIVAMCLGLLALPSLMGAIVVQGRQFGGMRYAVACVVQLSDLLVVWLGIHRGWSLPALAAVMMAPPIVTGWLLWVLAWRRGLVRPRMPRMALGSHARAMLRAGSGFFILELAGLLVLQAGYLIVVHRLGLAAVVVYAAIYRLIGLLLASVLAISQAYWPTFSEAWQRGERAWMGRAIRQMLLIVTSMWIAASLVIMLFGPAFIQWWLGAEARPSRAVVVGALLFAGAQLLLIVMETPLRGLGRTRTILAAAVTGGVLLIPLALLGAHLYGVPGVFGAQAVAVGIAVCMNAVALANLLSLEHSHRSLLPGVLRFGHALIAPTPIAGWIAPLKLARRIRARRDRRILDTGHYTITLCSQTMSFPVSTVTDVVSLDDAVSEEAFLDRLLASLRPGDVVYDVGANMGVVSILLARHQPGSDVRIEAFEPVPENVLLLRANLKRLGAEDVIVHPKALGASAGTITIRCGEARFEATVARGGDVAAESGRSPTVLKIDVEGAELDVLRGMAELFDQRVIREAFIEAHPSLMAERGDSESAIDQFMAERDYRLVWRRQRNYERHLHYRAEGDWP